MKQKILMVTMALGIGGAETHIVELSKELSRRGYEVIIASNGGIYVEEIRRYGIRHAEMPMNSRDTASMIRSYRLLKKLILEEKPDLVHAHARIPAFIAGLVRKSVDFPFVTSAHGVFDTTGILKYVSNWGDRTIAVSEDIKAYLREKYHVPSQNIKVTINGIDTGKFSPDISGEKVAAELEIDEKSPVICHVSRLDDETSLFAEQLIDSMPEISSRIPDTQLIIAGGGTMESHLRKRASTINDSIGRRAVIMTGPRTDINEIVSLCDVFVGVSRTALEAMACGKPVILAGDAGYMGIFSRDKLAEAKEDNFCCRVRGHSVSDDLVSDIVLCLQNTGSPQMAELCRFEREVIQQEYSVEKMTDDCIEVYEKAVQKPFRIVMSGYYGFSNAGDEAILNAIHRNLMKLPQNLKVKVLISNPEKAKEIYDFDMVDRFHIFSLLRAIHRCDLLISGGGSLLQDRTSTKSIMYYLTVMNLAKFMKKKVMLYANGIGPVIKPANRRRVCAAVSRADLITLRDENSVEELRSMGVNRDDMYVTADPVFTFDCLSKDRAAGLLKQEGIPDDRPFVGVSLRNWYNLPGFAEKIAVICDEIYRRYDRNIVFIVMQTPNDIKISRRVQELMESPSYILPNRYSTDEIMGMVGCADFVISMRLHTLIFAAHMQVPTLGLVYDPKVKYHLKSLAMPSMGDVEALDTEQALRCVEDMVKNRESYVRILAEKSEELRKLACRNEELLVELINRELAAREE